MGDKLVAIGSSAAIKKLSKLSQLSSIKYTFVVYKIVNNLFVVFFAYIRKILYLCSAEEHLYISMELCNHKVQSSKFKVQSLGRTELATHYFPNIKPMSAWLKLKALLQENPDLAPLSQLKRRTFLPSEVNKIYQSLGQP